MDDLLTCLTVAQEAAREAGAFLASRFGSPLSRTMKGERDFLTEADLGAEERVIRRLRAAFPSHSILSEEAGWLQGESPDTWIVDPLDGTINFSRGQPHFGVAIALARHGTPVLGVIYLPTWEEMYFGVRGMGAFGPQGRLQMAEVPTLDQAILQAGDAGKSLEHPNAGRYISLVGALTPEVLRTRTTGCAVVDQVLTARGAADASLLLGAGPWDVAAGQVLVEEAGGKLVALETEGAPIHMGASLALFPLFAERVAALSGLVPRTDQQIRPSGERTLSAPPTGWS